MISNCRAWRAMKRLIAPTSAPISRGAATSSGVRSRGSGGEGRSRSERSGASAERMASAASAAIARPISPTTRSALRAISAARASRARVVWPTTTSTVPVKSRSEKRRGEPRASRGGLAGEVDLGEAQYRRPAGDRHAGDERCRQDRSRVEHPVVGGERQELEGRGRDADEDLTRAYPHRAGDLVGGAEDQPVVGLARRGAAIGERGGGDGDGPRGEHDGDRNREPPGQRRRRGIGRSSCPVSGPWSRPVT